MLVEVSNIRLSFKNKRVETFCTDLKKSRKKFGKKIAESLFALINILEVSKNLQDINAMQFYNLHELKGKKEGYFALDINGRRSSYRLIVLPLND